jgi:hypothetical protein
MTRHLFHRLVIERESDIQRSVVRFYESLGCYTYQTSDRRSGRTTNSPGLPDLIVLGRHGVLFQEVKAPTGSLSEEQVIFAERCRAFGVPHVAGGVGDAQALLEQLGTIVRP